MVVLATGHRSAFKAARQGFVTARGKGAAFGHVVQAGDAAGDGGQAPHAHGRASRCGAHEPARIGMQGIAELYPDRAVCAHADSSRFRMLDQVAGSDYVRKKFSERNRFEDIQSYWRKDADRFRAVAEKYYLYK